MRGKRSNRRSGLYDLACFDTAGADANALVPACNLSLDRAEIDIPAALGHIVRMRNLVTELRTLAADGANLSHDKLHHLCFSQKQAAVLLCVCAIEEGDSCGTTRQGHAPNRRAFSITAQAADDNCLP